MIIADGLSKNEMRAVEKFQIQMNDELTPELLENVCFLYRFLKARNFDVGKAEIMLRKHLRWRKSFQVDNILVDFKPKEFFLKHVEIDLIGFDKEGDTVLYSPVGKIRGKDVQKCLKINDYMKHWMWFSEKIMAKTQNDKKGRKCLQTIFIVNLDQLTLSNATNKYSIDQMMRITRFFTDNYPEILKHAFVINAPSYYVFIFSILKPLLSADMLQKIHIFGNYGWQEKLLEFIDADVLPAFLGGNRTDPDGNPLCITFVNQGDDVSEKYHLPAEERWFTNSSKVQTLLVNPRSKENIIINIAESKSWIEWEFFVNGKDIGFGLHFKPEDQEKLQEILPIHDTSDGTEIDSFKSFFEGIYIITFDNSHSWMTSKEIHYCLSVIKPESRKNNEI